MSGGVVRIDRRGDVAVVIIDHPPVNAVGQAVRAGLIEAAVEIAADQAIRGAVLACAGRTFVAGADIAELGRPSAAPSLRDCCAAIEALTKPVVAALHGTALGGGLELALSCHYRVLDAAGVVGFPEVDLGIIPGAGGTQRLPRLIGASAALDLIGTGRRIPAGEAVRLGIVDAVSGGDRLAFAVAFLRERFTRPMRRLTDLPGPPLEPGLLAAARTAAAKKRPGQHAPGRAIDVISASAGQAFTAGLALERDAFEALRGSAQAEALRHLFFAERAAAKGAGDGSARPLERIGIVGGGIMGAGIAAACLLAGLHVVLTERDSAALAVGRDRLEGLLAQAVARGKLAARQHAEIVTERLAFASDVAALGEADLVVEAVFESLEVKQDVFRALDRVAKVGAVLATNTSYLDVAAIAAATARPAEVIGLHFFSPAPIMPLLEVVVPSKALPDVVATGFALARRLGKLGVRAGNAEGFIGNRILSAYRRAADHMVEDGASPFEVDEAFRGFGFPIGLYAMQDMAGLDIGWATRKRLAATRDPAERYVAIADRICERGWFGRKAGRGYYLYEGEAVVPNPAVDDIVADERRAKGCVTRAFTTAEIQDRILLAAVNEGAKLLDEGVARTAGDIDVVMVNGYGFPRWRGGPMHAANVAGLAWIKGRLDALQTGDPLWRVAPLIDRLAARQASF